MVILLFMVFFLMNVLSDMERVSLFRDVLMVVF